MESKHKTTTLKHRPAAVLLTLITAVLFLLCANTLSAQSGVRLFVSEPDLSNFPTVSFTVRTADGRSVPLPDVDGISVREAGTPIGDVATQAVPVGIDVAFVLDSNEAATIVNPDGATTRYETMIGSINRFATRFMNSGVDTVSLVVPQGENGRVLLDAATSPDPIAAELASFTPAFQPATPLDAMLQTALEQLAALQTDNRFQAILLLTDAGRPPAAVNALVEQAQANNVAIFVAIVGAGASNDEIANAALLYRPTNASYQPLPNAEGADPIYLIWQRQSNHVRLSYESRQRENGTYSLTVNLGQASAATEFTLALQPPVADLLLDGATIRRVGSAVDTPLTNLVPTVQPLTVQLTWPDGLLRQLAQARLLLDGQPAPLLDEPALTDGLLELNWDISELEAGAYELSVELVDALGKTAVSPPKLITVVTQWPPEPTPTVGPTPSPTPLPSFADSATQLVRERVDVVGWIAGGLTLLLGLLLLPFVLRRQRRRPMPTVIAEPAPEPRLLPPDPFPPLPDERQTAVLTPQSHGAPKFTLTSESATIGRAGGGADWQIGDHSLSLLHARIRWQNGRYWLYDEGSNTGTYLNNERLGLRPLHITENDQLRFGRLLYTFGLQSAIELEEE